VRSRALSAVALLAVLALLASACGSSGRGDSTTSTSPTTSGATVAPGEATGTITVQTVAPLADVVQALGAGFSKENPTATVQVATEEFDNLVAAAGAADGPNIIVAASQWVDQVQAAAAQADVTSIGRDLFVVVTPKGNPAGVQGLEAFDRSSGKRVLVCGSQTDLGNLAALPLGAAGVDVDPDVVRTDCQADLLDRVAKGELDAGLLRRSEATNGSDVEIVDIPEDQNLVVGLSTVLLDATPSARAFVRFAQSDPGKQILTEQGYLP